MRRSILGASLFVSALGAAFGQSPVAPPAFDVASVKASQFGREGGEGSRKPNVQTTPGSLNMRNFTLHSCVTWAYKDRKSVV